MVIFVLRLAQSIQWYDIWYNTIFTISVSCAGVHYRYKCLMRECSLSLDAISSLASFSAWHCPTAGGQSLPLLGTALPQVGNLFLCLALPYFRWALSFSAWCYPTSAWHCPTSVGTLVLCCCNCGGTATVAPGRANG